jgi:integrase/recombinase XerD
MLVEAERVAATPMKRVPPPETFFLEREEIDAIFTNMPTDGRFALRDRTLLLLLYNTGARVQEVAELRVANLALKPQPRVQLHGKGNKWRTCPLWIQTASLLEQLLEQRSIGDQPEAAVFASNRGEALTRYGIFKVVRRYTEHLRLQRSDGKRRQVSPHIFRPPHHGSSSSGIRCGS